MTRTTGLPQPAVAAADCRPPAPRPAPLSSEELLRGQRLVEITHNGEVYRLQATRLGKLILTK
jgi:hemin uptake protein HemP